jgi:chromosome segregation ATPase
MDYKAAIAALKQSGIENAAELVSAIEGHIEAINTKNYEVIGEKRTATAKAQNLETALMAAGKALGIEGDLEAVLSNVESKAKTLSTEHAQLNQDKQSIESRATEAETKVKNLERQGRIATIAAKSGAVPEVLAKLLGDKVDELSIDNDTVKIGDKSLREYVEADADLKLFSTALFPGEKSSEKTAPQLPGGSPAKSSDKPDPLKSYFDKTYTGLNALTKKPS